MASTKSRDRGITPYDVFQNRNELGKAMKAANMENLHYLPMCDLVHCKACKKRKDEKAPWNRVAS